MGATRWGIVLFVGLLACNSDDSEDTAAKVFGPGCDEQDCRGDPTGSWTVASGCAIDPSIEVDSCPGFLCQIGVEGASGSYTFGADASASFAWSATVTADCEVPKDCIAPTNCAELDTMERSCSDEGDVCVCHAERPDSGSLSGTWRIDQGFILTVEDGTAATGTSNWCVRQDAMAINVLGQFDGKFGPLLGAVGLAKVRLTLLP